MMGASIRPGWAGADRFTLVHSSPGELVVLGLALLLLGPAEQEQDPALRVFGHHEPPLVPSHRLRPFRHGDPLASGSGSGFKVLPEVAARKTGVAFPVSDA